ncbi:MAG TPA: aminotransferase class V-fold PLP-dependent enzyme, partial [Bacteroidales bacterium]|nr:aminotransferase class V-fold PLP-dependent enzyme [Bacteroidales bacterium]
MKRGFASDNNAGVHPDIMKALENANDGHCVGYGDDPYTQEAQEIFRDFFGDQAEIYFVFLGTAANVLGLKAMTQSFHSIICADTAHINTDECGAPEKFTGCKLLSIATKNGKISVPEIQKHVHGIGFEHHSQPRVISITQSTEMGTIYTVQEIADICDYAHKNNMLVHVDGARIANACASLNVSVGEMIKETGVDVLSFGGTKNGMMYGEAIVFLKPSLANDFKYIRKQGMQLASKMRFISAQFLAYFHNSLWLRNAAHANEMAKRLSEEVKKIPQVKITQEVQSNGVFAIVPKDII